MADIVYLGVIVGFFVFATAVVEACERIIGPDELTAVPVSVEDPERFAA